MGVAGAPLTGAVNAAPVAAAGADQNITLPATALLTGSVTDDGNSGAPVSTIWSKASGPGTVTFGTPNAFSSTAIFSTAGTYVLTLTASDGDLSGTDSLTIQVNAGPNVAPVVNAGPDQTVVLPVQALLAGIVSDDGQPGGAPTTLWSKVSGPGTVNFAQVAAATTTAALSAPGTYVLMLTANDGALASSDTLVVTVNAPVVLLAPNVPVLNSPAVGSSVASPATLNVSVSDGNGDPMTVTYYGRQKSAAPDFTVVAIPDTQHYVDDPAPRGDVHGPDELDRRQSDAAQHRVRVASWRHHRAPTTRSSSNGSARTRACRVLEANNVPYGMSPGNHDQYPSGVANFYDQFFPPSRFLENSWYGGYLGAEAGETNRLNKDNYELFSVGGLDFLVIHIETDWPGYAVTWADKIIKRYPNRRVILSTHAFLNTSSERPTSTQFGRTDGSMSAEAVWQQLIRPNCNVFMVINGHYPGEGRRTDLNDCGQPVHQVLTDYQSRANGGDGWLRYYTFKPSENKIYAYTYSPTRSGGAGEFETDAGSQFVLDYAMQGTPFTVLATNSGVASGANTTAAWSGLVAGTEYEWYVTVNDGTATTTGPVWSFTGSSGTNSAPVAVDDAYTDREDGVLTPGGAGVIANDTDPDDNSLTAVLVQGTDSRNAGAERRRAPSSTRRRRTTTASTPSATGSMTAAAPVVGDGGDHGHPGERRADRGAGAATIGTEGGVLTVTPRDSRQRHRPGWRLPVGDERRDGDSWRRGDQSGRHVHLHAGGGLQRSDSFTSRSAKGGTVHSSGDRVDHGAQRERWPGGGQRRGDDGGGHGVAIAVLANDTDVDGDILSVTGVSTPAHGSAAINPDQTITYTPAANYHGADSFGYMIGDGNGRTATATVTVTVTGASDGPVAVNDAVTTAEDTTVSIAVLTNDSDLDGDMLTVSSVTVPAHGTAVINPDTDDRLYAGRELRRRGQLHLHDCGRRTAGRRRQPST